MQRVYTLLGQCMEELLWSGNNNVVSEVLRELKTEHRHCEFIISLLLHRMLSPATDCMKPVALLAKSVHLDLFFSFSLLYRLTTRGRCYCSLIVALGGVPFITTIIGNSLRSVDSSCGESFLSNNSVFLERANPSVVYATQCVCSNATAALANICCYLDSHIVHLLSACDIIPDLIALTKSKLMDLGFFALETLSNIAVQADTTVWKQLVDGDFAKSFSHLISLAIADHDIFATGKGSTTMTNGDRESVWQGIFEVLECGISSLGRVMEVCTVEFLLALAATPLIPKLERLFR